MKKPTYLKGNVFTAPTGIESKFERDTFIKFVVDSDGRVNVNGFRFLHNGVGYTGRYAYGKRNNSGRVIVTVSNIHNFTTALGEVPHEDALFIKKAMEDMITAVYESMDFQKALREAKIIEIKQEISDKEYQIENLQDEIEYLKENLRII